MNNLILFSVIVGIIGLMAGLMLPRFAERISIWKCMKKNRQFVEDKRFTGIVATILCCVGNAIGWGLCWYFGSQVAVPAILAALIWSLGIVLILIDLRLRLIPNEVLLGMLVLGVPMELMIRGFSSLLPCIFATIIVFAIISILGQFMGFYKIGAGDAKLAMVMTMSLGYPTILTAMFGMAVSLFVVCIVGLLLKKITLKSMLPLGPFLVPGYWIGLLVLLNAAV